MLPCAEAAAFVTTTPPIPPELLEHLEDAVVLADASRTILWASRRTAELFAWSHPELVGQKLDALLSGEADDGGGRPRELEARRRDGTAFPVTVRRLPTGDDGRVLVLVRDLTEHRRAEEALKVSEERYALAIRGANDGIWDWDLRSSRVGYSDRWQRQVGAESGSLGTSPDEWFSRVHPEDLPQLTRRLHAHLAGESEHFEDEYRIQHADGAYRWMLARGAAIWDAERRPTRIAGSQTDITDRKVHDPLTGLPNRALFLDRLERARARARRREKTGYAVAFVDLDRFKTINDSLGHPAGDLLLIQVARRIEACLRAGDTVARMSGDEFALLYEEIGSTEEAVQISERIHEALQGAFLVSGHEIFVTASVGIALGDRRTSDLVALLSDADTAMYRAKMSGRGRTQVFTGSMRDEVLERLRVESELRGGLSRGEFEVHYQPIVSLRSRRLDGFEALVRWNHPERGQVLPAGFIGIAEETGTILPLGMWVLEEACRQAAEWRAAEPAWSELSISVNLSPRLFNQPDLVPRVAAILERTGLPARYLKLEITEGLLIEDPEEASRMIRQLRQMGVGICLDDFGTGYSSLSYLNRFAVDVLKIDRSFIRDLAAGGDKVELVRNIVRLAASLGLTVVAEGVETIEQRSTLDELDCELMQGYEFSRPLPAAEAWKLFHADPA